MLSDETKKYLRELARQVCEQYGASRAYFAQKIGNRRHFLEGWGVENFQPAIEIDLDDGYVLFVKAKLTNEQIDEIRENIASEIVDLDADLD